VVVSLSAVADAAVGAADGGSAAGSAGSPHPATNALVTITKIAAESLGRLMRTESMRGRFVWAGGAINGVM